VTTEQSVLVWVDYVALDWRLEPEGGIIGVGSDWHARSELTK